MERVRVRAPQPLFALDANLFAYDSFLANNSKCTFVEYCQFIRQHSTLPDSHRSPCAIFVFLFVGKCSHGLSTALSIAVIKHDLVALGSRQRGRHGRLLALLGNPRGVQCGVIEIRALRRPWLGDVRNTSRPIAGTDRTTIRQALCIRRRRVLAIEPLLLGFARGLSLFPEPCLLLGLLDMVRLLAEFAFRFPMDSERFFFNGNKNCQLRYHIEHNPGRHKNITKIKHTLSLHAGRAGSS